MVPRHVLAACVAVALPTLVAVTPASAANAGRTAVQEGNAVCQAWFEDVADVPGDFGLTSGSWPAARTAAVRDLRRVARGSLTNDDRLAAVARRRGLTRAWAPMLAADRRSARTMLATADDVARARSRDGALAILAAAVTKDYETDGRRYLALAARNRLHGCTGLDAAADLGRDRSASPAPRRAARELAQAARIARRDVVALLPVVNAKTAEDPFAGCAAAVTGAPARAADGLTMLYGIALGEAVYGPLRATLTSFAARLAAVAVTDRTLRVGRDAVRADLAAQAEPGPTPAEVCGQLVAWQALGYPASAVPGAGAGAPTVDRTLLRFGRRLRALGVDARSVRILTGDALLTGVRYPGDEAARR